MQPSDFIQAVVEAVKEVDGIDEVLAYEPIPGGVTRVTAWVDLEALTRSAMSIESKWEAEATILITIAVPQAQDTKLTAWDLGMTTGFHLRSQRWANLKTEPAELIDIARADLVNFEGDLDAVEVQLSQQLYFRAPEGDPPPDPTVYAGISPDVGPDHIDDYVDVTNG